MLVGKSSKEIHGEESKMPLGSQNWVVGGITGLLTEKGGVVEEGEAEIINLASDV